MTTGRYLLVRLSALGDVVFALEALAALRAASPDAAVDWVVEDRAKDLLVGHPWLERVLVYPRRDLVAALPRPWRWPHAAACLWRHLRALRQVRYDAVLDLHGNLKSGLHVLCTRAKRKIGFAAPRARELSWLATRERVRPRDPRQHRATQGLWLVEQLLGRTVPAPTGAVFPARPDAAAAAEEFLAGHPRRHGRFVCLAPGTSAFAAFKRWPVARFQELAAELDAEDLRLVVLTGPGEEDLARRVLAGNQALWLDGTRLGLSVTLEVLRRAALVVAADSGALHMAQAVGIPAVALFGPKDPVLYGPRQPDSIVLRYFVACAPCGRRDCAAPTCVQGIPVAAVREAVRDVLAASAR